MNYLQLVLVYLEHLKNGRKTSKQYKQNIQDVKLHNMLTTFNSIFMEAN